MPKPSKPTREKVFRVRCELTIQARDEQDALNQAAAVLQNLEAFRKGKLGGVEVSGGANVYPVTDQGGEA